MINNFNCFTLKTIKMTTYLNTVPKDLSYLIFYKIKNVDKLFYNEVYKEILGDTNFWEGNIKYSTRGLNLELIPQWLYNYKGLRIEIAIENFSILDRAYQLSRKLVSTRETIILKPTMVSNIKAYVDVDKIISNGKLKSIREYEASIERNGDRYNIIFDKQYYTDDVALSITLNYQQTVDLVTHSICNYRPGYLFEPMES